MFACAASQQEKKRVVNVRRYPFEISMNDSELVKVGGSGHNLGELRAAEYFKSGTRGGGEWAHQL